MHQENHYFDVHPKIVRAGRQTDITIRSLFADDLLDNEAGVANYRLSIYPIGGRRGQTVETTPDCPPLKLVNEGLQVQYTFASEQEYVLHVEFLSGDQTIQVGEFRVYALEDDLFTRRPYKGDLHLHSRRSDGQESPAYVAGACRRIGLDFMAVTDHRRYEPSLEAIEAYRDADTDLRIYPGEEVHLPDAPVHIVNFGGSFSVNDFFAADKKAAYYAEVQALADALVDFPAAVDRYPYAACAWCYDKIRESGGLGIFCHPYWFTRHCFDVPETLTDLLFERQPFDAFEVIGGYQRFEAESNILQTARYYEERARGKRLPVVGVSDAHGCETGELFGWYFTIVFAPSLDLPDLVQSIKDLYSVAVEALPGTMPRAHGPFRLVRYAQFLLREILPQHDELCIEEGRLMLAHIASDERAAGVLRAYKGRTMALYDHLWARDKG